MTSTIPIDLAFACYTSFFFLHNTSGRVGKDSFSNCSQVKRIQMDDNDLQVDSDAFARATKVRIIVMINSVSKPWYISENTFRKNIELRILRIKGNSITGMSAYVFIYSKELHTVDMSDNLINDLGTGTFRSLSLKLLDLSNNNLSHIKVNDFGFVGGPSSSLNLSHNKISKIDKNAFGNCSTLEKLDLSHNHIRLSVLDEEIFDGLASLIELDLSYNQITRLVAALLQKMLNLKHLNIANNPITVISPHLPLLMSERRSLNVDFSGCPIKCRCGPTSRALHEARRLDVELPITCDSGVPGGVALAHCSSDSDSSSNDVQRGAEDRSRESFNKSDSTMEERIVNGSNNSIQPANPNSYTPAYTPYDSSYESTYSPSVTSTYYSNNTDFPFTIPTTNRSDHKNISQQGGYKNISQQGGTSLAVILIPGLIIVFIILLLMFIWYTRKRNPNNLENEECEPLNEV